MTKKIWCKSFTHFHQFSHTGTRADPEVRPITNFKILPFCILCTARTDPEFCLTTNTILSDQLYSLPWAKKFKTLNSSSKSYNFEQ